MKKEIYVKYVNKIKDYIEKEKGINNALRTLCPDFGGFGFGDLLSDFTNLLALSTDDDSGWTDYYVWETDCGENSCADSVQEEDGTKIPFKTPEDVYNLIMSEKEDNNDDIIRYLVDERDRYKRLYQNERDHSGTLQSIIDKLVIPVEAKEAVQKTTTSGVDLDIEEWLKEIEEMSKYVR